MIAELLPRGVVTAESFGEPAGAVLPAEAAVVATAGRQRRAEFAAGRALVHAALTQLGVPAGPVLPGRAGEPVWPAGVVGSLTHCAGYRACAVARATDLAAVGIDAEPDRPLPDRVLDAVAGAAERARLAELSAASPGVPWDLLLFSAKESVYKAWFSRARLEFAGVRVDFSETGGFTALVAGGNPPARIDGRWLVRDGLAVTAATVTAPRRTVPVRTPAGGRRSAAPIHRSARR
jgi:4'-phosphopantetheinyl transferase EntD